jgi:hypothetical protein
VISVPTFPLPIGHCYPDNFLDLLLGNRPNLGDGDRRAHSAAHPFAAPHPRDPPGLAMLALGSVRAGECIHVVMQRS